MVPGLHRSHTHGSHGCAPLNSRWKGAEYEYGLQDSGSKVFFCDPERYAMAKEACDKLDVKVVLARGDAAPEGGALFSELSVRVPVRRQP